MAEETSNSNGPKKLQLRKYPNRRYYDMSRSRYVTLEEIYELIQAGYEVEVSDSKTGDDITARVLTQIMLDLDPPKLCAFSVPLLHRLIRANEQLVTDFVERYFNQMMSAFLDSQKAFEQSIRHTMGLSGATPAATPMPAVPPWMQMWGPMMQNVPNPWTSARNSGPRTPPPAGSEPPASTIPEPAAPASEPAATTAAQATRSELDELRQQIEALRAQIPKQQPKRRGRPRHTGGARGKP